MIKKILAVIALGILPVTIAASQIIPSPSGSNGGNSYNGNLISNPGLAYSTTAALDLSVYNASKVSAQAIFSTVTFANATFSDGSQSTGSVSLLSYVGLSSTSATDQVTVISTTGLTGACLTVWNYALCYGQQWNKGATVNATAANLAAALSAVPNLAANVGGTSGVIYTTATYGSYANSYNFTSNNTSVTVATPQMQGGADNACLTVNGVPLCQGTAWLAGASTTTAVLALGNAIAGAVSVSTKASGGNGAIYSTSTFNGSAYNYSLVSSTPTAMSVFAANMVGGVTPGDKLGSGILSSSAASGFTLGLPVLFPVSANPAIGGLSQGTTYYVYPLSANSYELVKYSSSAVAGSPASDFVTVTSTNSQIGAHTYTISVVPWLNAGTFVWQSSNDNSNWFTSQYTGNVSTGTVTIYSTTTAQDMGIDFGVFNYRYLRFNYTAPTDGGLKISVPVTIKQDGIGRF